MSRFRKNRDNVISTIQESPKTWIYPSNKSAERENSHQVWSISYILNLVTKNPRYTTPGDCW